MVRGEDLGAPGRVALVATSRRDGAVTALCQGATVTFPQEGRGPVAAPLGSWARGPSRTSQAGVARLPRHWSLSLCACCFVYHLVSFPSAFLDRENWYFFLLNTKKCTRLEKGLFTCKYS